ncbi:hypothetical protein QUB47_26355 [Microcoleus sp. AT9_B5]
MTCPQCCKIIDRDLNAALKPWKMPRVSRLKLVDWWWPTSLGEPPTKIPNCQANVSEVIDGIPNLHAANHYSVG